MAKKREYRTFLTGAELGLKEISHVGHGIYKESFSRKLAAHKHSDCFEICYLRRGQLNWWASNKEAGYEVNPGEITITYPNEPHGGTGDIHEICEIYWIGFVCTPKSRLPGLSEDENRLVYERLCAAPRCFSGDDRMISCFEEILAALERSGPLIQMRVRSVFHQLLLLVCDSSCQVNERSTDERLERVISFLKSDMLSLESVGEMADVAGLSPNRFINNFRSYTGYSPKDYVNRMKIKEAKKMLAEQLISVTEITFSLNFSSTQYFATVFKKFTGMTPSGYRKEMIG